MIGQHMSHSIGFHVSSCDWISGLPHGMISLVGFQEKLALLHMEEVLFWQLDKNLDILSIQTQILNPKMHDEAETEGYTMNL
jgi:hypothetical protein